MAATCLAVAQGLAIVGLGSILINAAIGVFWPLGAHTSGLIVGPFGVFTSIAAFFVSWNKRTILVSALLVASGLASTIDGILETRNLAVLTIPGPILEFIFGVVILALAVAKSLVLARAMRTKTAAARRKMTEGGGH
jgi:hypothetical protein